MQFAIFDYPTALTFRRTISMCIYPSSKPLPYVYMCTHKLTGKYYIGYREANVSLGVVSSMDLPNYRTSSKTVNPDFENYEWIILAEFFDGKDAYDIEQQLIFENWDDPFLINENHRHGSLRFRTAGPKTDEHKKKLSESNKGKTMSESNKQKLSQMNKGKPVTSATKEKLRRISQTRAGVPRTQEVKSKISKANKGRILSDEHKKKLSDAKKGKLAFPFTDEQKAEISRKISLAKKRN